MAGALKDFLIDDIGKTRRSQSMGGLSYHLPKNVCDVEQNSTDTIKNVITRIVEIHGAEYLLNRFGMEAELELMEKSFTRITKLQINIIRVILQSGMNQMIADHVLKKTDLTNRQIKEEISERLDEEWGISASASEPVLDELIEGAVEGVNNRVACVGKSICAQLKQLRKMFARANQIEYEEMDCTNEDPCSGTCPYCEEKNRYLMEEAKKIAKQRKLIYPRIRI